MKTASMIGSMVVTVALVFYSLGYFTVRKKEIINRKILTFYSVGVLLDITATILMIIGSGKGFTLHGLIGYSALLGMLTDTILIRRARNDQKVPRNLRIYSAIAYAWWAAAYVTGGLLVALRHV